MTVFSSIFEENLALITSGTPYRHGNLLTDNFSTKTIGAEEYFDIFTYYQGTPNIPTVNRCDPDGVSIMSAAVEGMRVKIPSFKLQDTVKNCSSYDFTVMIQGEPKTINLKPKNDWEMKLAIKLMIAQTHERAIRRKLEHFAVQAAATGKIITTSTHDNSFLIDFKRDASLNLTLSAADKWDNPTSKPINTIGIINTLLSNASDGTATDLICSTKISSMLQNHQEIRNAGVIIAQSGGKVDQSIFNVGVYKSWYCSALGLMIHPYDTSFRDLAPLNPRASLSTRLLADNVGIFMSREQGEQPFELIFGKIEHEEAQREGVNDKLEIYNYHYQNPTKSISGVFTEGNVLALPKNKNFAMSVQLIS